MRKICHQIYRRPIAASAVASNPVFAGPITQDTNSCPWLGTLGGTTVWFWIFAAALAIAAIFAFIRYRSARNHTRERLQEILIDARTAELQQAYQQIQEANKQLVQAALTDPLTGLYNRRFLTEQLQKESARNIRLNSDMSDAPTGMALIVIDIDHFKKINDKHGHLVGDELLSEFAGFLTREMRESDYVVRWGGDEFIVLAVDSKPEKLPVIAKRIVEGARKLSIGIEQGRSLSVTCSVGIAHFPFFQQAPRVVSWEQLIHVADVGVYMAKSYGRDGWVSIRGGHLNYPCQFETLLQDLQQNPQRVVATGKVKIESSYQPDTKQGNDTGKAVACSVLTASTESNGRGMT